MEAISFFCLILILFLFLPPNLVLPFLSIQTARSFVIKPGKIIAIRHKRCLPLHSILHLILSFNPLHFTSQNYHPNIYPFLLFRCLSSSQMLFLLLYVCVWICISVLCVGLVSFGLPLFLTSTLQMTTSFSYYHYALRNSYHTITITNYHSSMTRFRLQLFTRT